jgi:hypothetical protein
MTAESKPIEDDDQLTALRDHAWDYFELHAEQRLKTFHFYILLETGLIAAMLLAARVGLPDVRVLAIIGLTMVFFSYVFWKLDFRTKGMIKVAEEALRLFERRRFGADEQMASSAPFTNDPQARGLVGISPFGTLSYSKCFGAVFVGFGLLGLAITALSFLTERSKRVLDIAC